MFVTLGSPYRVSLNDRKIIMKVKAMPHFLVVLGQAVHLILFLMRQAAFLPSCAHADNAFYDIAGQDSRSFM